MVALTSLRTCIQRFRTSHPIRSMWSLLDVSMSRWCTIASCNSSLWIGPVGRCDRTSLPTPTRNWRRSSSTTSRFVFYKDFAIQMPLFLHHFDPHEGHHADLQSGETVATRVSRVSETRDPPIGAIAIHPQCRPPLSNEP